MMSSKKIAVSKLQKNPFRDLERNPLNQTLVESLMRSIETNDLWRGIVVRPVKGGYEMAFGHHRVEAIRGLGIKNIEVDVADLTDIQMLRFLKDENLNQGGNNVAAQLESSIAAKRKLDEILVESDTPEAFLKASEITATTGGSRSIPESVWVPMKNSGRIGRTILRVFIGDEIGNDTLSMAIKTVNAEYDLVEAKVEKEAAEDTGDKDAEDKADKKREDAEIDLAYRDIAEMFPHMQNAVFYIREIKLREQAGKPLTKSQQIKHARTLIKEGTSKRDIPRRLAEILKDAAEWEKAEKARKKKKDAAAKKKKKEWRERWESQQSMTPDEYIMESFGAFERLATILDNMTDVMDFVDDNDLLQEFVIACANIREKAAAISVGLRVDKIKKVA